MDDAPPRARGLLLDIGGVILRNARELIRARVSREGDAVGAYVAEHDVAGPDDAQWSAMLRHEITERQYWADRAREIGAVLGHEDWTTRDLMTWLYHDPEADFLNDEVVELMVDTVAAGLPLVAFTNDLVDFHGREWADAQDWLKHFDRVVDGSDTGILKPDPRAYDLAIEATGLPAGQIVYLDDMPVNVRGGVDAGLLAIEVLYEDRHAAVLEARRLLDLAPVPSQSQE
jgi:putative hydrolase of the HAD superfamily